MSDQPQERAHDALAQLVDDVEQPERRRIEPGLLVRSAELLQRIDDVLAAGPSGRGAL